MTAETRNRALKALEMTHTASFSEWYFPMVFVVGTHIFFTYMAAVRMRNSIKWEEGLSYPIEKVTCPHHLRVNTNIDQRGELMKGEVFPSKEFAQLINS